MVTAHAVAQTAWWSLPLLTTPPRVLVSADCAFWLAGILEATSKSAHSSTRALAVWRWPLFGEEERRALLPDPCSPCSPCTCIASAGKPSLTSQTKRRALPHVEKTSQPEESMITWVLRLPVRVPLLLRPPIHASAHAHTPAHTPQSPSVLCSSCLPLTVLFLRGAFLGLYEHVA